MSHQIVADLQKELVIDCPKEEARIIEFIQATLKQLDKDGVIIGLSGGLDSSVCAYLLKKALGKRKVLAVLLPERDSATINHEHAHFVAKTLGVETIEHDMTKELDEMGVYDIGSKQLKSAELEARYSKRIQSSVKRYFGGYFYQDLLSAYYGLETSGMWKFYEKFNRKAIYNNFAFQFTKVRLRMVYLYFYADQRNDAVIGTTDKSEYSAGIYCKYGDGANDVQILLHLYKTQIRQLARYLQIPPEIINKPNTGDLYGNLPHTANLGMGYEELDTLLYAIDKGYPADILVKIVPEKGVKSIRQLIKVADFIKKMPLSINTTVSRKSLRLSLLSENHSNPVG
jgi:NAD+ synthase